MNNQKVRILTEIAMAAALAYVLSFIKVKVNQSYGITLSLIPIFFISMRRGFREGLLTGFVIGLLRIVSGNITILSALQVIIEYLFAFMCSGFTGLWANKFQLQIKKQQSNKALLTMGIATFTGALIEYFVHFIAGVVYWGQYAPEGVSPIMFSAIANGVSGFFTWLTAFVTLVIIFKVQRPLFQP